MAGRGSYFSFLTNYLGWSRRKRVEWSRRRTGRGYRSSLRWTGTGRGFGSRSFSSTNRPNSFDFDLESTFGSATKTFILLRSRLSHSPTIFPSSHRRFYSESKRFFPCSTNPFFPIFLWCRPHSSTNPQLLRFWLLFFSRAPESSSILSSALRSESSSFALRNLGFNFKHSQSQHSSHGSISPSTWKHGFPPLSRQDARTLSTECEKDKRR